MRCTTLTVAAVTTRTNNNNYTLGRVEKRESFEGRTAK